MVKLPVRLYSVWQRYNFESNLQLLNLLCLIFIAVFSMTKIQFWKQFTTVARETEHLLALYSVWQRYNFESNLQRDAYMNDTKVCCIQYDKDTILKAIYNRKQIRKQVESAVFSMTKIQFWKQFTTQSCVRIRNRCCIQYDKDTILKAIYNRPMPAISTPRAVFSMTKIQFWKQFTTIRSLFASQISCIQYDKDTILKAIYNE